jgi:glycosyltransferase involved in cell wall biosynthesis
MVVLQRYLDVIKASLCQTGYECDDVISLDEIDKDDLIVFPMGIDAFRSYWKGFKNFILWQQGVTADESYMRNKSKLRYWVLNYIDCFAMKKAKMIFFCSQYMKQHYERLSKHNFDQKSYLMPCYNEELLIERIHNKDYTKKTFAYVGSLDLWQCFDEIASLYKKIENDCPDAHFKVLTFSVQPAIDKLRHLGIRNYEVKRVSKDAVQNELRDVVYGFIVRRDSVVNRVATPTKLSSYLSVGTIPIFSTVLDDFNRASQGMEYVIPIGDCDDAEAIKRFMSKTINKNDLEKEYTQLFASYYGTENHITAITKIMGRIFQ